ncbi:MAG: cell envelope integrity protein TolA, partial [Candidatus Saccharibacteria bacterium]|nr:cell envelope integrity protein TolA [Moraxellaceae bacterium]
AAKAAQEKADKLAAKVAQEKADKLAAAKAAADAKRRLSQSLGNDDAELGNLKSQVAANAKANSIGKYKSQISSKIYNAWRTPQNSAGLKAVARITLNADGSIASFLIIKSSGNEDYDASVRALQYQSGLPVPEDLETLRQVNPLVITFTPK